VPLCDSEAAQADGAAVSGLALEYDARDELLDDGPDLSRPAPHAFLQERTWRQATQHQHQHQREREQSAPVIKPVTAIVAIAVAPAVTTAAAATVTNYIAAILATVTSVVTFVACERPVANQSRVVCREAVRSSAEL